MDGVVKVLLNVTRAGVLLVPLLPLVTGGRPWGGWVLPATYFPDVVLRTAVFRILAMVLFALWAVLACLDARWRPRIRGTLPALLAFVAVMGLAGVLGHDSARALWSNLERMEGWIGLLCLLALFVAAAGVMTTQRLWTAFFHLSFAVAVVVAATAWLQYLWPETFPLHKRLPELAWFRADAWLGNAVYVAIYLNAHVFLAIFWLLRAAARRRPVPAVLYAALALLFVSGTYHTATRAATYLAMPLGVGAIAFLALLTARTTPRVRRASLAALAAVAIVGVALTLAVVLEPDFLHRLPGLRRLATLDTSLQGRNLIWGVALEGVMQRPLLGWGQENFVHVFDLHHDFRMWPFEPWWDHPHNVFLGWAVAGGVVGFAAYVWLFVSPLLTLWRRGRDAFGTVDRCVLTGWLISQATIVVFVFDSLLSHVFFLMVAAWIHALALPAEARARRTPLRWAAPALAVAAVPAVGWMAESFALRPLEASTELAKLAEVRVRFEEHGTIRPDALVTRAQRALEVAEPTIARDEARLAVHDYARALSEHPAVPDGVRQRLDDLSLLVLRRLVEDQEERATPTVKALLTLALELVRQDRAEEAVEVVQRAESLSPRLLVLRNLAHVQREAGRPQQAIRTLQRALEMAPASPGVKKELAELGIETGNEALASDMLRRLYGKGGEDFEPIDPRIVNAAYRHGRVHVLLPVYERRLMLVERGLRKGAKIPRHYVFQRYMDAVVGYSEADRPRDAIRTLRYMARRVPGRKPLVEWLLRRVREGHRLLRPRADGRGFELAVPGAGPRRGQGSGRRRSPGRRRGR